MDWFQFERFDELHALIVIELSFAPQQLRDARGRQIEGAGDVPVADGLGGNLRVETRQEVRFVHHCC